MAYVSTCVFQCSSFAYVKHMALEIEGHMWLLPTRIQCLRFYNSENG